jgi:uncharacterized protein (DUF302 family)
MNKTIFSVMLLLVIFSSLSLVYSQEMDKKVDPAIIETSLGFSKIVDLQFDQALQKVKDELKKEGFGILTEVDVKATMKKKLDIDYRPYHILGACNPPMAHESIQAEPQIGLMLPCKLIVYVDEAGKTIVAAVDPVRMMAGVENAELSKVAQIVQEKFKKVLSAL